jgi:hypothetical protein
MCICSLLVLFPFSNKSDLGFVRLLFPQFGLSMVAGSSVLGGGQVSQSEVLGLVPVLFWLVAPFVLCCRVVTMAALELRSPTTKYASRGWIPSFHLALMHPLLVVRLVSCAPQAVVLLCCGATHPVCERLSSQSLAFVSAGCLELICWKKQLAAAMPHQV